MSTVANIPGDAAGEERRALISELFHALSQPLTALRCSLELALHDRRPAEPSRASLRLALQHAEKIARLARGIRELVEYGGGHKAESVSFDKVLREAVADLQPVAEFEGVELALGVVPPCLIKADAQHLEQALFYLLESAVAAAGPGGTLQIEAAEAEAGIAIVFSSSRARISVAPAQPSQSLQEREERHLGRRLGMAIAGRYIEAVGGRLYAEPGEAGLRLHLGMPWG